MTTSEHEPTPKQCAELHVRGSALFVQLLTPTLGSREGTVVARSAGDKLRQAGNLVRVVVLDFGDVDYVDSGGLGAVVTIRNEAKDINDAQVVIFGLRDDLLALLKLTKLDRVFKIANSAEELSSIVSAGR